MAENDGQEKTERPTPKRLQDARKRGQVPRSVDLSSAGVMMTAAAMLYMLGESLGTGLAQLMRDGLSIRGAAAVDPERLIPLLSQEFAAAFWVVAPIFGATILAALSAPLLTGGWNFSVEALAPKFERLDPIKGIGRMFSTRSLVELGKGIAKFSLVGIIAYVVLRNSAPQLLSLGSVEPGQGISAAGELCAQALLALVCALVVIAGIDVPYQLWKHSDELKMSRDEIRREMKESEGSPEIKGRIRSLQQAMARNRMMQDVPLADVVVTNPTHYAVALRYDDARMRAPIVVAKGADLVAARIREIAAEHDVPLVEAPPLARALHGAVDIGHEVPAELYVVVAQVLTYVYQLRAAVNAGEQPPSPPVLS